MSLNPFENFKAQTVDPSVEKKVLLQSKSFMTPKVQNVALRYSVFFVSSIFFSLTICPQRGVGFLRDSYPLFHHLLHQSEILCGLYCGLVFYSTTHLMSFFLLTHFERLVLVKKITYLPLVFISLFFGLSMTSSFSNLELSPTYFTSWICAALSGFMLLNSRYKKSYISDQSR